MSQSSTTSRSGSVSTSSSPVRTSGSPLDLTPRSRVRALLARIDGDSDEEGNTAATRESPVTKPRPQNEDIGQKAAISYQVDFVNSDDDEPVGTKALATPKLHDSTIRPADEDDNSRSSAYARMKQQLLSKPAHEPVQAQTRSLPFAESDSESDEDIPVRKSKIIRRSPPTSSRRVSKSPSATPPRHRKPSPGLFVSPTASSHAATPILNDGSHESGSDSDALPQTAVNPRLQELVAKKRAERHAKEQAEKKKAEESRKAEKKKQAQMKRSFNNVFASEMDDGMDEEAREALTQASRPTRKASKKALEEMNRETQRMARNQQLTHQAKVKKKITTKDFFKLFNFRPNDTGSEQHTDEEPTAPEALVSSDAEGQVTKDTPPSSPPSREDSQDKPDKKEITPDDEEEYIIRTGPTREDSDQELPTVKEIMLQSERLNKGKGKATEAGVNNAAKVPVGKHNIILPKQISADSDDDLEIVEPYKPSRFAVFDRVPVKKAQEPSSLLNLRALAHLTSPSKAKPKGRTSMNITELQIQLHERMRKQALAEKEEKLNDLRARGILIQTEEERERDQLELENLLDKARREAQELAKKEKDAAKKEGKEGETIDGLPSDDESEDADWEEEEEEADVELSGSEEEEVGEEDEGTAFIDNEAGEDEEEEELRRLNESDEDVPEEDGTDFERPIKPRTKARMRNIIVDEDDDDETSPLVAKSQLQQTSQGSVNDAIVAFGFQAPQSDVGLTQMFKGTMADLDEAQDEPVQGIQHQDSIDFLRQLPTPTLPEFSTTSETQQFLVEDSQTDATKATRDSPDPSPTKQFSLGLGQFQTQQTQIPISSAMSPTKFSEVPEPTQDTGFETLPAPIGERNQPHSTVETVMAPVMESPLVKKKGKLRRRVEAVAVLSDDDERSGEESVLSEEDHFELTTNAFDALFKAAKKPPPAETFDKNKSEAKKMVEEQAEESEDEYAGLGGASDDESTGEVDEEMQKMIDEGPVHVDESKLAKFYADKERAEDEKRIDKLYKDITTGLLRRKRGADLDDLSDSDDEAEERRRRKQREFARMRKALLEDENIGKIAENPKKLAFLRAIEDRDEEDGFDYLEAAEDNSDSMSASQDASGESSTPTEETSPVKGAGTLLKRKLPSNFSTTGGKENVPPMDHRRRPADETSKRAKTLAEIREAVSFLVDEPLVPDSQVSGSEYGSDHEDEEDEDKDEDEQDEVVEHRMRVRQETYTSTVFRASKASVVNRLSIIHTGEESLASGPLAFHAPTVSSASGFKMPNLLRRATTNLSNTSTSSSGTATPTSGVENGVRRGGSKKSNIHYQAREAERKKIVESSERRRKEQVKRSVLGTGRQSVLGALGGKSSGFE